MKMPEVGCALVCSGSIHHSSINTTSEELLVEDSSRTPFVFAGIVPTLEHQRGENERGLWLASVYSLHPSITETGSGMSSRF